MAAWIWIILGIIYILSPYDLLPDFIPIRGWIDDGVVIILLYRYIARLRARKGYAGSRQGASYTEQQQQPPGRHDHSKNPYEILGVPPGATKDQIHKAYLNRVNQYHPDKVAHLGKEFQELAEERFKEIQEAYQTISHV